MPYLESTTDEFLEIACEAVFSGRKKKTVDELLAKAKKTLNKKLKTVADCEDYMAAIRSESTKFNECLKTLQAAKKKYDAGKLVPKDFDETVKGATMLLNKNCKQLQANLGNFVDDKRAITSEEIAAFNEYVKGLGAIVKEIKQQRKASAAKEDAFGDIDDYEMSFDSDTDFAFEAADDADTKEKDEEEEAEEDDDKKSKKSSKKSKSKKDDDEDEDESDDEDDEDKDDDKKSKSKKDDDDDLEFDDSDFDFGDDDKGSKKSDKDDDDDSDEAEEDDDKKSKKSSKKSKSKKDDDEDEDESDDEDDEDKDDDKKSKSAKESVFGDIFDFDD